MNTILRAVVAIVTVAATTCALAHAKLQKSEPENGSTVTASPTALKLHYNEPIEPAMSSVKLTGFGDTAVQTGKPVLAEGDDKTLVVPVSKLTPGSYRIEWSTMGRDGHHMKGDVRFTVK
jgi:methionine-rich copper-binding protein CopC